GPISPRVVPAPTTAALNTNTVDLPPGVAEAPGPAGCAPEAILRTPAGPRRTARLPEPGFLLGLHGEPPQRPAERVAQRAADEDGVREAAEGPAVRKLVLEREIRDRSPLGVRHGREHLRPGQRLLEDLCGDPALAPLH